MFGLIERAKIVKETRDGQMQEVEIKRSDWVFNAISGYLSDAVVVKRIYDALTS